MSCARDKIRISKAALESPPNNYGSCKTRKCPKVNGTMACLYHNRPCPVGFYCPPYSGCKYACEAGYVCSGGCAQPQICNRGFFCPPNATAAVPCKIGEYCPVKSVAPLTCPWYALCVGGQRIIIFWFLLVAVVSFLISVRLWHHTEEGKKKFKERLTTGPEIHINGFGAKRGVKHATASFYPSEVTAVMGASGCGKSTLASLLSGAIKPNAGRVSTGGEFRLPLTVIASQTDYLPPLTVLECVQYAAASAATGSYKGAAEEVLRDLNMEDKLHASTTKISGGEQKRVSVAMALVAALVGDCELIILDECTSSSDSCAELKMLHVIKKYTILSKCACMLILHRPSYEALCYLNYILLLSPDGVSSQFTLAHHAVSFARLRDPIIPKKNELDCLISSSDAPSPVPIPLCHFTHSRRKAKFPNRWRAVLKRHVFQWRSEKRLIAAAYTLSALSGCLLGNTYRQTDLDMVPGNMRTVMPLLGTMCGLLIMCISGLYAIKAVGSLQVQQRDKAIVGAIRNFIAVDIVSTFHAAFSIPIIILSCVWAIVDPMQPFFPMLLLALALGSTAVGIALMCCQVSSSNANIIFVAMTLSSAILSTSHPTYKSMSHGTRIISKGLPLSNFVRPLTINELEAWPTDFDYIKDKRESDLGYTSANFYENLARILLIGLAARILYVSLGLVKRRLTY